MTRGIEIAKVIGWTCFGITLTIMYFGMFSVIALSNVDSEIRTYHEINMDNGTKDALIAMSNINNNCDAEILNETLRNYDYIKFLERELYKESLN